MRFIVHGSSMSPTFQPGDKLFVSKFYYRIFAPKVNDIVIVKDPRDGKLLLKRIKKITKQGYYIVGDNPKTSTDSRAFGEIDRNKIVGRVLFRYFQRGNNIR